MMHHLLGNALPAQRTELGKGSASVDDLREPGGGVRLLTRQHVPVLLQRERLARVA